MWRWQTCVCWTRFLALTAPCWFWIKRFFSKKFTGQGCLFLILHRRIVRNRPWHSFLCPLSKKLSRAWCPVHFFFLWQDDVFPMETWEPNTREFENLGLLYLRLPCPLCSLLLFSIKMKKEGICEALMRMLLSGFWNPLRCPVSILNVFDPVSW